jgi:ElaB/YqjD/DUF883 family membrane-anchored ribosome-binding protein
METALQELLKYVESMPNQQAYAEEINCIKERIKQLLPKEREQIEQAYQQGREDEYHKEETKNAQQYYETNFNK